MFIGQRRKTCIFQQGCKIKNFCFASCKSEPEPMTGQRTNTADLDDRFLLACIRNSVRNIDKRSSLSQRFDFAERDVLHCLIPRSIEFILVNSSPSLH